MSREDAPSQARECNLVRLQGGFNTVGTPFTERLAHELIDTLPESATWEDVAYEVELRASIERGWADADAGRLMPVEDLLKEFGVEEWGVYWISQAPRIRRIYGGKGGTRTRRRKKAIQ